MAWARGEPKSQIRRGKKKSRPPAPVFGTIASACVRVRAHTPSVQYANLSATEATHESSYILQLIAAIVVGMTIKNSKRSQIMQAAPPRGPFPAVVRRRATTYCCCAPVGREDGRRLPSLSLLHGIRLEVNFFLGWVHIVLLPMMGWVPVKCTATCCLQPVLGYTPAGNSVLPARNERARRA